ncbi:DUF1573 domain-containing protein [Marinifilum caeruleilacunae]|uniref:DUF1573 domain-containing protein n=1 Tax=Marinifilum caeruleilacunae TaxID=2499076 RepID=UPI001490BEE2
MIKFESKLHDFGTFKEELGKQTHLFEFVNEGKQPIIIKHAYSSCGCTSPEWSKKPIAPGQKGYIKAIFDPKNRPGTFAKTITVTANTNPSITKLIIKGKVIERVKTIADFYPAVMSGLRFQSNHLAFTKVKNNEKKELEIEVYNESDEAVSLSFKRMPAHLQIKMIPEELMPKEKGKIVAMYDGAKKNDWGNVIDHLDVLVNQEEKPNQRLSVTANIVEDFSMLTENEKKNAPRLEVGNRFFNFGELEQGESVEHIFKLKNSGKSDLIIRKTKSSCGCATVNPGVNILKPGEETDLKIVFHSRGRRGNQSKTVYVITNDPFNQESKLIVKGRVKLKQTS